MCASLGRFKACSRSDRSSFATPRSSRSDTCLTSPSQAVADDARAGRNVQNVQLISADDVNAEHILRYRSVVVTGEALETLAKRTA